jgi:hypothetical protein
MNIQQLESLNDNELNFRVAKALEWTNIHPLTRKEMYEDDSLYGYLDSLVGFAPGSKDLEPLKNWACDLNACYEMEEVLLENCIRADFSDKWNSYEKYLHRVVSGHDAALSHQIIRAKPRQRCIAFLLALSDHQSTISDEAQ